MAAMSEKGGSGASSAPLPRSAQFRTRLAAHGITAFMLRCTGCMPRAAALSSASGSPRHARASASQRDARKPSVADCQSVYADRTMTSTASMGAASASFLRALRVSSSVRARIVCSTLSSQSPLASTRASTGGGRGQAARVTDPLSECPRWLHSSSAQCGQTGASTIACHSMKRRSRPACSRTSCFAHASRYESRACCMP